MVGFYLLVYGAYNPVGSRSQFLYVSRQPEREREGAALPNASAPNRTILLVEDNENDAALLKLMFRRSRILNPLQVVESVQEGIGYLKGEARFSNRAQFPFPILLIVDARLPDGSGFDLLRWLQNNRSAGPVAVVMLTGTDVNAYKLSYELGAQSFLTKPLKFEDFRNMVERVRGIKLASTANGYLLDVE